MKRIMFFCGLLLILGFGVNANAYVYTWTPNPADLNDLDHHKYYTWGINWPEIVGNGSLITAATISIANINDWTVEDGDILYIHLLDGPTTGVTEYSDNQGGGDNFAGLGIQLTTYSDTNGSNSENWSYSFDSSQLDTLKLYAADDGMFGFGFDPDCHYYNDGITFSIQTSAPVPEPATMLLFGVGLCGLAFVGRKKLIRQ